MRKLFLIVFLIFPLVSSHAKEKKSRRPAASCPSNLPAETPLEQAFENQKATVTKNGVILSDCVALAKDVVSVDATEGISDGQQVVTTKGVKTASVYSCKTNRKFQAIFKVYRFQPIENSRFNGFNGIMNLGGCSAPTGAFVTSSMTMLNQAE